MMIHLWMGVTQPLVLAASEQASEANVCNSTPPIMLVQAEDDLVHPETVLFTGWRSNNTACTWSCTCIRGVVMGTHCALGATRERRVARSATLADCA